MVSAPTLLADPKEGLAIRLDQTVALLSSVVDELDPERMAGTDATALYASLARTERLVQAGKALLGPRIEASGAWKVTGHHDAASLLADLEGVSAGEARRTLELGRKVSSLPGTEEAMRAGGLSRPKLTELAGAGIADPRREGALLRGAESEPLAMVQERCRRARATAAGADPVATLRAIHARRYFSSWTDAEGAFCYRGRDTADRGARLLAELGPMARALRRAARRGGGDPEPEPALLADALFVLLARPDRPGRAGTDPDTGETREDEAGAIGGSLAAEPGNAGDPGSGAGRSGAPDTEDGAAYPDALPRGTDALDLVERPPPATVIVRVDIEALRRGRARPGETCEVLGQGQVPVAMARALANDAFLALCFHRAGDIKAVSHLGRTVKAVLRTALLERDRTCVVPGCSVTRGLEIDHVVPFAEGGPTELDNLALLCHHHHFDKSYGGFTLCRTGTQADGTPTWSFEPQPAFGREPELGIDTAEGRKDWHRRRE